MKKNKFMLGWFFISLLMAFCVTACNDDDDNVVNVTFPEKQTIGGAANDIKELTFDATADWQLTSSSTWCYFITEQISKAAKGEYTIAGKAGKHTVKIGISNEGQDYDKGSVAVITLIMNGQEAIIAEVTRNPINRELKLYKQTGENDWVELAENEGLVAPRFTPTTSLEESYNRYKVVANFRFAASNRPEWLKLESGAVVGSANQEVIFGIKADDSRTEFIKNAHNGNLTFQDEEGKCAFTFAVNYEGMDQEAMLFEGPSSINWEVSLDGKTFTQTTAGIAGSEESKSVYNKFVDYQVTAFNDDFMPIFVEEYTEQGMTMHKFSTYPEDMVNWMHLTQYENGKVRITVDESTAERKGYVFVFPKALYEKIKGNEYDPEIGLFIRDMNTFSSEMNYKYAQNNLLMEFSQKEEKQAGGNADVVPFSVEYFDFATNSMVKVELTKVTNHEFGEVDVYSMEQPNTSSAIMVDPMMKGIYQPNFTWTEDDNWTLQTWMADGSEFTNTNEHEIVCEDEKTVTVWLGEYVLTQNLEIHIKDMLGMAKKILIITPRK